MLDFSDSGLTFDDLTITQDGTNTIIADADGNSITLNNMTVDDITAEDFIWG